VVEGFESHAALALRMAEDHLVSHVRLGSVPAPPPPTGVDHATALALTELAGERLQNAQAARPEPAG
jgi:hypothetical protein